MAAGFEFFTSADVGAPTMNGAAGRMIAVLDWVLVTKGGWTKVYTGTNLAVYRSDDVAGNRFYLRVDDTQAQYARLRAYRSMTAVSTGTNPFPNATQAPTNNWGVRKNSVAGSGATVRRYWGVRTNRYVVLVVEYTDEATESYNYRNGFVFGDAPTLCEADSHSTILMGIDVVNNTYPYFPWSYAVATQLSPTYSYSTLSQLGISGTPNGAVVSPLAAVHAPFATSGASAVYNTVVALSGRTHFADFVISSTNSASVGGNGSHPRCRLPNLHMVFGGIPTNSHVDYPCHDEESLTIASKNYLALQAYSSITNNPVNEAFFLEKTDTDGAL